MIEPLNLNQEKFEKFPAKSISIFSHNLKSIMYFGSGEFSNYTGKCVGGRNKVASLPIKQMPFIVQISQMTFELSIF